MQASGTPFKRFATRFIKALIAIVLIVPLVACFLYLMLQAGWLNPIIRYTSVKIANSILDAELSIESIHGNPMQHLEISGIELRKDDRKLAGISLIRLDYNLDHALDMQFTINEILIDSVYAYADQLPDSTWNLAHIVKPSEPKPEEPDSLSQPRNLSLLLHSLRITNSSFDIHALDPRIPKQVRDFNLDFNFAMLPNLIHASVNNISFTADSLHLKTLRTEFTWQDSTLLLQDFLLETDRSKIKANGQYSDAASNIKLRLTPFDLRDVEAFLPEFQHPDTLFLFLDAQTQETELTCHLSSYIGENHFSCSLKMPDYQSLDNFSISINSSKPDLLKDWGIPFSCQFATIKVDNTDGLIPDGNAKIRIQGTRIQYEQYKLDIATLDVDYTPDMQKFTLDVGEPLGNSLYMKGNIDAFNPKRPYKLNGNLSFNTRREKIPLLPFDVSGGLRFTANGELRSFKYLLTRFDINIKNLTIDDYRIKTGTIWINIEDGRYELAKFDINTEDGGATGMGYGSFEGPHHIEFDTSLPDLSKLQSLTGLDNLAGSLDLSAKVDGMPDSMRFSADVEASDAQVNDLSIEKAQLHANGTIDGKDIDAEATVQLQNIRYKDLTLEQLSLDGSYHDQKASAQLEVKQNRERYGALHATYKPGEIELPMLDFHFDGEYWQLAHDSTRVRFNSDGYFINDFSLASNEQRIGAKGYYRHDGSMDADVRIDSLDLSILNSFLPEETEADGILNLDMKLRGNLDHPDADATLRLNNLAWGPYEIAGVNANLATADNSASFHSAVRFTTDEQITLDARVPLGRFLKNIPLPADSLITANVVSDSIDIGFVNEFTDQIALDKGHLVMDISLESDLRQHNVEGRIKVTGQALTIRQLNTRYEDFFLELHGDNSAVRLDTLYAEGGSGTLSATGTINLGDMKEKFVDSFDIQLLANHFQFSRKRQLRLVSDMDIHLFGDMERQNFDADVKIIESRVDIDQFTGGSGPALPSQKPLLVQALNGTTDVEPPQKRTEINISKSSYGTAKVNIPRNSWIYGKDMSVEYSGDIKAVKEAENIYLTGTVATIRGYYNLYGRKFTISEAKVTFTGGKEIDPILDITADYTFRDIEENRRTLSVVLTGRASDPQAEFLLDGTQIEQADAISYIIFNRSTSELTQNEKSSMNESSSSSGFAQGLIIKQLSSQLTRSIQEQLDLDVLEIQGNEDLSKTAIVVGKYITNRLFLSYERRLNNSSSSDTEIEILTLEYQINRAFSIQATRGNDSSTGMDLIWKYEHK